MKRVLSIIGVVAVAALIVFLAVTRYLAQERAAKLDRALMDAQAQVIQLEADKEAANQRLAELMRAQPAPPPAAGAPGTAPATAPAAAQPAAGSLVRYVAFSQAGLTNLVRIEGTSSVHDWQVEGHLMGGSAELGAGLPLQPGAQASPGPVQAKVSLFIPVRSLKSKEKDGRLYSDAMDEIMYGKLLEPANKRITYTLTSLALKEQPRGASDPLLCEATGNLVVAGVTKAINMPVSVVLDSRGYIQFAGSVKAKMTDFKIEPPSPSLGGVSIKTGDEVTLRFVWWVKPVAAAPTAK
jgi:hypothetical protein